MPKQKEIEGILATAAARCGSARATSKQCSFLAGLIVEDGGNGSDFLSGGLTKKDASRLIEMLVEKYGTMRCSDYQGDDDYSIDATGDVVAGDEVRFDRVVFSGSYRKPRFAGFQRITATVASESYGAERQQHTFTLELASGKTLRIKGRNLYRNGVYRKPWSDENARGSALDEKHERGDDARFMRDARILGGVI